MALYTLQNANALSSQFASFTGDYFGLDYNVIQNEKASASNSYIATFFPSQIRGYSPAGGDYLQSSFASATFDYSIAQFDVGALDSDYAYGTGVSLKKTICSYYVGHYGHNFYFYAFLNLYQDRVSLYYIMYMDSTPVYAFFRDWGSIVYGETVDNWVEFNVYMWCDGDSYEFWTEWRIDGTTTQSGYWHSITFANLISYFGYPSWPTTWSYYSCRTAINGDFADHTNYLRRERCIYTDFPSGATITRIEFGFISAGVAILDPDMPDSDTDHWDYVGYYVEDDYWETVYPIADDHSWNYTFLHVVGASEWREWDYEDELIDPDSLGCWGITIFCEWNWLRDALCAIVNVTWLFIQWIIFLVGAYGFQVMIVWLPCMVLIPFAINIVVWGLWFGISWFFYWVMVGLKTAFGAIWAGLVWVYENILLPFFAWFWETAIPFLVGVVILLWSLLLTSLLYLISGGTLNWTEVYDNVYAFNSEIANFFITTFSEIFLNADAFLYYTVDFLIILALIYIKYIYCKARGYQNRTKQLYEAYTTYLIPVKFVRQIARGIKDVIWGA